MYDSRITNQYMLNIIGVLVVFTAMNYARPVLVPFFLACFLAITIQPALRWLNRYVPRWVSAIVVTLLLLVATVGGSSIFVADMVGVAARIPIYADRFKSMLQGAIDFAASHGLEVNLQNLGSSEGLSWIFGFLTDGLQSAFGVLAETVLVLFMMVFLLMEGDEFQRKVARSFTNHTSDMLLDSVESIISRIQTYMIAKTIISLAAGICTSLLTWIIGLEFPLLWGASAFFLHFIPNVGPIIAVAPPVVVAFLQFDTLTPGLVTLIGLTVILMTIGNIIEPRVMAHSLDLSTLVVFVSMIFWGWLWGMVGVVLAVPLTAAIKIICEHIEGLHPIAILLGERAESVPRDVPLISSAALPAALPAARPPSRAFLDAVASPSASRAHLEPVAAPRRSITLAPSITPSLAPPLAPPLTLQPAQNAQEQPLQNTQHTPNAVADWSTAPHLQAFPPSRDPRVMERLFGAQTHPPSAQPVQPAQPVHPPAPKQANPPSQDPAPASNA